MFELVVSRYKEDLSWIRSFNFNYKIYNKGNHIDFPCVSLKNEGREAKTFLYHIVENYDALCEYTIFLQGNPFDHCQNLTSILKTLPESLKSLPYFSQGCYCICHRILCETQAQLSKFNIFPEDFHNAFFYAPCKKFRYGSGAQYIVSKKNIKNKPKAFYQKIHDSLMWDTHEPWSIERVWPNIFDRDDKYKYKII